MVVTDRQVTYTVTVNGQSYSATAKFDVKQPTVTNLALDRFVVAYQIVFGVPRLKYGTPPTYPGVTFTATSNNNGITGSYQWVQIYNESKTVRTKTAFTDPACGPGKTMSRAGSGLDVSYPYTSGLTMNDSPDITLVIESDLVTVNDSASAWLMFRPSLTNAIWVPLRKVDWSWGGSVRRIPDDPGNYWEKVPGTEYSNPEPTESATTTFPIWSRNVNSNVFVCPN